MRHYLKSRRWSVQNAERLLVAAIAVTVLFPAAAQAYIGPGVGAGAIAAVLGVIGSVLLAVFAVVYYPIKRMLKKKRKPAQIDASDSSAQK